MAGKTYTANTDDEGIVTFTLKDSPKTYNIKVTYNGNTYYTPTAKTVNIKVVKPTIKISKEGKNGSHL